MTTEIITCLIVQIVVLVGYILTFASQKRKDRITMEQWKEENKITQADKIDSIKKDIQDTLNENRKEYLDQIADVNYALSDIKAAYQETTATFTIKIEELSNRVEKHNNVIERTYRLEKDTAVLETKEKDCEHRLKWLESQVNRIKGD